MWARPPAQKGPISRRAVAQPSLNSAIVGLSYDLAVLEANYALERSWADKKQCRNFQVLQKKSQRVAAGGAQLKIESVDETERQRVAQAFQRVR
jgi:hypothetical protein